MALIAASEEVALLGYDHSTGWKGPIYLPGAFGDSHSLVEELHCYLNVGGNCQRKEASDPPRKLVDAGTVVMPGNVDDVLLKRQRTSQLDQSTAPAAW